MTVLLETSALRKIYPLRTSLTHRARLVAADDVSLVKASYHRPTEHGGGGRTTELVARPLLSLFLPELTGLHQPLSQVEQRSRQATRHPLPSIQPGNPAPDYNPRDPAGNPRQPRGPAQAAPRKGA